MSAGRHRTGRPGPARIWHDEAMSTIDWSTPEGLAAITTYLGAQIPGWRAPVAHGIGLSSATSSPAWEFRHLNRPGGRHALPAVVLATVLGHDGSTATLEVSKSDLREAITSLAPAEACTTLHHPNLAAWRVILAEVESNPLRTMCAVFVADPADQVSSEADATVRLALEGKG